MSKRTFSSELGHVSKKKAKRGRTTPLTAHSFALSSTAFSVCLALSSYGLPALVNSAHAAGPKGGVVVGGKGDISKIDAATTLINQASQHMAINWDSYNIAANETVRYVQPNASAVSLNRILGVNGSTIAGQIQSNGQVILINPNGLIFTDTAVLNVGGIIASGLDMSPTDFMNGDYIFNDLTYENGTSANGTVINRGIISASLGGKKGGNVALIGKQVINEGLIEATLGTVTLAAGKQAILTFDAGGVLGVRVSEAILQDELGVDPALINSGEISAKGGRVLLTASASQDVFSQAVNSGLEQATSVVMHADGSFTLGGADVVNSGKIDVSSQALDFNTGDAGQIVVLGENITSSGEILADVNTNITVNSTTYQNPNQAGHIELHAQDTLLLTEHSITSARGAASSLSNHNGTAGGTIKALADNVGLFDHAVIDASGSQGGEVYIGGDVQGLNPLMPNAQFTYLGEHSQVRADGLSVANGDANSQIANNGDGGKVIVFAENTSRVYGQLSAIGGHHYGDGGFIETSGLQGFDIQTIPQITATNGQGGEWLIDPNNITIVTGGASNDINNSSPAFTAIADGAKLGVELIHGALTGGASVIVTTDGNIYWGEAEGSQADLDFDGTGTNSLTLNAGNSIFFVHGDIKDSDISTTDVLNLNLNAKLNGTITEGIIKLGGIYDFFGTPTLYHSEIFTGGGNFTSNSTSFETTAQSSIHTTGTLNHKGGDIDITALRDITVYALTANGGVADKGGKTNSGVIGLGAGNITLKSTDGNIKAASFVSAVGSTGDYFNGAWSDSDGKWVESDTVGQNGGAGGNVKITATTGTISTKSITTDGGIASGDNYIDNSDTKLNEADGGNAGTITLSAANDVTVAGALNAIGGVGIGALHNAGTSQGIGGNGGDITITAKNVSLSGDVNASVGAINQGSLAGDPEGIVNINLSGSDGTATIGHNDKFSTQVNIIGDGSQSLISTSSFDGLEWLINSAGGGSWRDANNNDTNTNALNLVFTGIKNFTGGVNADVFNITETGSVITGGIIDGGAGAGLNSLARTNSSTANDWVLDNATAFKGTLNSESFLNIQTLTGSAAVVDTLTGRDQNNDWQITGANEGSVESTDTPGDKVSFSSIENITGGGGIDTFNLGTGAVLTSINAGGGNDIINIQNMGDVSGFIDGGGDTTGDTINLQTGGQTVSLLTDITGIEAINARLGTSNNTLVGTNNDTEWNTTTATTGNLDSAISFANFTHFLAGSGIDTFNLGAGTVLTSINAGGGNDIINIQNMDDVSGMIDGGADTTGDTINLKAGGQTVSLITDITGLEAINALIGTSNTLAGSHSATTWNITSATQGNLDNSIDFKNFTDLTGGDGVDTFELGAATVLTSINAGGGNDIINIQDMSDVSGMIDGGADTTGDTINLQTGGQAVNISTDITRIETLNGNGTANTLSVNDGINTWTVDSANDGDIASQNDGNVGFSGFSMLNGGADADTFEILAALTSINAGAGNDIINMQNINDVSGMIDGGADTTGDTINLKTGGQTVSLITDITGLEAINALVGTSNTLAGSHSATTWNITSATQGNLDNAIDFKNFTDLTGGDGVDTFELGAATVLTSINAGGGNDIINIQDMSDVSGVIDGGADTTGDTINLKTGGQTVSLITDITGIEAINALVGTSNTLAGSHSATTWNITSATQGNLDNAIDFKNFTDLTGGDGVDTFELGAATVLTSINAGGGNDIINIQKMDDVSGMIDGGGNTTGDTLNLKTGGQTVSLLTDITGIEAINAFVGTNNILEGSHSATTWNITSATEGNLDNNIYFKNFTDLAAGDGIDTFHLGAATALTSINAGGGNDIINIQDMDDVSGMIDGGGNTTGDTLNLKTSGQTVSLLTDITGIEAINAFVGTNNILEGSHSATTWNITSATEGNLDNNIYFKNFTDLAAGDGIDTFHLGAATALTSINAGGGNDIINIQDMGDVSGFIDGGADTTGDTINLQTGGQTVSLLTDITGIEAINARLGTSNNTLVGTNNDTEWNTTTSTTGNLDSAISFANFTHFLAGSGIDTFNLGAGTVLTSINAGGGNDIINIQNMGDVSGFIDGGGDTTGDTINLKTGAQTVSLLTDITNIETINALVGTSNNTLVGTNNDTEWNTTTATTGNLDSAISFANFTHFLAGSGIDTFNLGAGTVLTSINAGGGNDIINIQNMGDVSGFIDGGGNTTGDTLNLQTGGQKVSLLTDITGFEAINALVGTNNILEGSHSATTWNITSATEGNLDNNIYFKNFTDLAAGDGIDTFNLGAATALTSINAGGGNDIINIQKMDDVSGMIDGGGNTTGDTLNLKTSGQTVSLLTDITGIEAINALIGSNNVLEGSHSATTWNITSATEGNLDNSIDFKNFTRLLGGSGIDTFELGAATALTSINAGGGNDIINIQDMGDVSGFIDGGADTTGDTINLQTGGQTVSLLTDITGIETINAKVGTSNTLTGSNADTTWNTTSATAGNLNGSISFANFTRFLGGSGVDTFELGAGTVLASINAGGGNDIINIQYMDDVTGFIDGGGATTGDTLNLQTGDQTVSLLTDITGIEAINALIGSNNVLEGSHSATTWNITSATEGNLDNNIDFKNFTRLLGGSGIDTFHLGAATALTSINAGGGNDIINIQNMDDVSGFIDGGGNTTGDTLNILTNNQTVNISTDITRIEILNGSGTGNNLSVNDGINTWTVDSDNGGDIASQNDGNVDFTGFNILNGGSDADGFTVRAGGSVDSISAGAGADTVLLTTVSSVNNAPALIAIDGGTGSDVLTVDTGGNTWTFSATPGNGSVENGGITRNFNGFETLSSAVGSSDTLDYSALVGASDVELHGSTGIGTIIGNGLMTLIGSNGTANDWFITGTNDGNVDNGLSIINFQDFKNLTGGDGVDSFTITNTGSFDGLISGAGDTNTLTGRGIDTTWTINNTNAGSLAYSTGTLITTAFTDIADVTGGSSIDTFNVTANISSLKAGDGNDVITVTDLSLVTFMDGEIGTDQLTIDTGAQTIDVINDINGINILIGTGTDNTITAGNGSKTWTVDGVNSGEVAGVDFRNFENLQGGSGVDTFNITGTLNSVKAGGANDVINIDNMSLVTSKIDGESGNDTVQLTSANQTLNLTDDIVRVEIVGGFGSGDTLAVGNTSNNTWTVNGNASDEVDGIKFTNFENLVGGSARDTFNITTLINSVKAGAGDDTININSLSNVTSKIDGEGDSDTVRITSANQTLNLTDDIVRVETVQGFGSGDTLAVGNTIDNTWTVNGNAADNVDGIKFTNFTNFVGGSAIDTFNITSLITSLKAGLGNDIINIDRTSLVTNKIDGEGGSNTVNIKTAGQTVNLTSDITDIQTVNGYGDGDILMVGNAINNTWTVNGNAADNVDGIKFTNFENLVGGSAIDTFNITSLITSLKAGTGNDIINIDSTSLVTNKIDGEGGSNTVNIKTAGQTVNLTSDITNIQTVNGYGNGDILSVGNAINNTWTVNGNAADNVAGVKFTNFENLVGGSAIDTFNITSLITSLKAGLGNDIINIDRTSLVTNKIDGEGGNNTVNIKTAGQTVNLTSDITDIQTVNGYGDGDILMVGNTMTNTWTVNGNATDNVAGVKFTNFANLVGGSGTDIFLVTALINSLNAGGGNDDITVNNLSLVTTTIDGSTGTDDRLTLIDNDQFINLNDITGFEVLKGAVGNNILQGSNTVNTWIINQNNEGTVNNSTNTLAFINFTDLEGGSDVDTFTITAAINSLDAGAGDDIITVQNLDVVASVINGGDNNDKITLLDDNQTVNISNAVIGVETIIGSATGSNILQAGGAINTWLVDGTNKGSVDDGAIIVNFENFTDLQGIGNNVDNFEVTATGSVDSIHAGAGNDSVLLASVSSVNDTAPGIAIDGGAGIDDKLVVDTLNNTWAFLNKEDGSVSNGGISRKFANFEGQSSKAGSKDTFDYSNYDDDVEVNLNLSTTIGTVIGNLDPNFTSTIIGLNDTSNTWSISKVAASDGVNDGSVTANGGATVIFRNFDVLTGGNNTDTFTITDSGVFDGTINGGLGSNTLTGSNTANVWVIDNDNAGSLSYSGITTLFNDIEHVVGGSAVDDFTVSASLSSLSAGADNDFIHLDIIDRVTSAIDGDDGDDTVNVSIAGQEVNLATDITRVEFLNGTGSNVLQSGHTNNTWQVTTDNNGTFSDNVTLVNFTSFNTLNGGSGVDNVTLSADITNLNTGAGNDIINLDRLSRVTNAIDGGANNDTLNISLSGQIIELGNGFTGIEVLNGTGSNTLQASNTKNTWTITDTNKGTVGLISFNSFDTLIGGNVIDDFTMADMNLVTGLIDGGIGTDSLTLTTANQTVVLGTDISRIENVFAKAGTNTLQASDVNNSWQITGDDRGTVAGTSFINFSDLVGGSADDSFTLAAINQISGVVDGGTGPGSNKVTLTTANQHIILDTDIKRIDSLVAAIGDNTLQAANVGNTWNITGNNEGNVAGVSFSHISDLVGGSAVDKFTLTTMDQISGLVNGGAGIDTLTVTTANEIVTLSSDITQLENLKATNGTLVGHNEANAWVIDANDGGTITNTQGTVTFRGFANLTGGSNVDSFTVSGASGELSGLLSGAGGSDSLVLSNIKDQVIELGTDVTANFNVDQIENITANRDSSNTLLADNVENVWLIDGNETGSIAYSGITTRFSHFDHLIGGTTVDKFTVNAGGVTSITMGQGNDTITSNGGNIAVVQGNEGDDTFTMSGGSIETMHGDAGTDYIAYTLDNASITLGDAQVAFEGISALQGNGILNAQDDVTTTWTISEENKGTVIDSSAGSASLIFSGFANLNGGSGVDNFTVRDNGAITGIINGGASADTLTVNLDSSTRTQTGAINFNGGTGDDVVHVTGTRNKFAESYNPNVLIDAKQYDQLDFTKNNSTVNVAINYRNVATVNDTIETTSLVLNNSLDSDSLSLSNNHFGASSALIDVTFSAANKGDITVSALDNSKLVLTDSVDVNGDLTITASEVTQTAGTVTAQRLILDDVTRMGSGSDGIETNVAELLVQNHTGEIYLNEQDDIVLNSLVDTTGLVSINSELGAISSNNILTSTGALDLTAATDINLLAQNQLTGELSLVAANDIVVNNNAATNITALTANNATINSANNLTVAGDINVAGTSAADNSAGVLTLSSTQGDINLAGHTQADSINLNAANDINVAGVSTKYLAATSANGNITGTGAVSIEQSSLEISTLLTAEKGAISFENTSNDFNDVSILANSAVITDQNGLALTSAELTNNLTVNANGDVLVSTLTAGESIAIDAGNGAIVSQASNITAPSLTLRASTGIGSGSLTELSSYLDDNPAAILTNTANLSAINADSGIVNIVNQQEVNVTDLRNNGDIVFTNTGDINLIITQVDGAQDGVMKGAVDANYGQDILNEVYSGSVKLLNDGQGSVYGIGNSINFADITAENLTVNSVTNFGSTSRSIRLRVNDVVHLWGIRALIEYYGAEPNDTQTSGGLVLEVISSITGLSAQQLVQVESLDDVDPAIFADIRNYNVDDTSVLLPRDQRNNDEEEEHAEGEE